MKDRNDQVIYVGKAKAKKSIEIIFYGCSYAKTTRLVGGYMHFEFIVTSSEKDSHFYLN
ncbi:hypothetical protein ACVQ92_10835 [Staphylococcus aureus]